MESQGINWVSREFKTESISSIPSEFPNSDISSSVDWASLPAAAICERKSFCASGAAPSNPAAGAKPRSMRASTESFATGLPS